MSEDLIRIEEGALNLDEVARFIDTPTCGGRVIFSGNVRPEEKGESIEGLHYAQYPEMALRQMNCLVAEIRAKWAIERLAIVHRVGYVPVGESSVLIGVGSAHRREAFEAAQFAIARLKEIVPIWKGIDDL